MKRKITNIIIFTNLVLLTGCSIFKKKDTAKKIQIEEIDPIENVNNLDSLSDTNTVIFDNTDNNYNIIEGKSIFVDDEDISTDSDFQDNNLNESSDDSITAPELHDPLNDTIIPIKTIQENNQNNIDTIESSKKHIGTVQYAFNAYKEIKKEFKSELHYITSTINTMLQVNPNLLIIIEGHACNSEGSERYNIELSNKRALTMKNYIINNTNINPENLSVFGCGTSHLIVYGNRAEQSPNRRAEIFTL